VLEAQPRILPQFDAELSRPVSRRLAELGVTVLNDARAKGLSADKRALLVEMSDGKEIALKADTILVTVGREPAIEGFGLETLDLDRNGKFIRIDEQCRTSMRGVYAIGDVTGEPMLAHRAMAQGEMVAEQIAGHKRGWDKVCVPAICFTDPEIVAVGMTARETEAAGIDALTGAFPFKANGRALTLGRGDGLIRIVARRDNHLLLGIHGVGTGIAELAAAFTTAIEMRARVEDVAGIIHAHPTQSEAFHAAALKSLGRAIHI
jgi:dihydrolipoamide dehydrogenase